MAWKGEELEAAVVAGVWDMIYCDGRLIYEVVQRTSDDETGQRARTASELFRSEIVGER